MQVNAITDAVIGAAIEVHKVLGPGLLESAYVQCLCYELTLRKLPFALEVSLPVIYKGLKLDCGYRMDMVVADMVVVEVKAVERLPPYQRSTTPHLSPVERPPSRFAHQFQCSRITAGDYATRTRTQRVNPAVPVDRLRQRRTVLQVFTCSRTTSGWLWRNRCRRCLVCRPH